MNTVQATARVSVTIDVTIHQPFDETTTIAEVHKKATSEALDMVIDRFNGKPMRINGAPKCSVVITEQVER